MKGLANMVFYVCLCHIRIDLPWVICSFEFWSRIKGSYILVFLYQPHYIYDWTWSVCDFEDWLVSCLKFLFLRINVVNNLKFSHSRKVSKKIINLLSFFFLQSYNLWCSQWQSVAECLTPLCLNCNTERLLPQIYCLFSIRQHGCFWVLDYLIQFAHQFPGTC